MTAISLAAAASAGLGQVPGLVWLATGLVVLAAVALGLAVGPALESRRARRIASLGSYQVAPRPVARPTARAQTSALAEHLVGFGERQMRGKESTRSTMALIARADLPFRPGEWYVLRACAGLVGGAVGVVLTREAGGVLLLLAGAGGLLAGLLLTGVFLKVAAQRRAARFEAVLPDVLLLVATSLRSGFGLAQALDSIARDAPEPAAKEFSRALAESRIGTDLSDALEHMAERMGSVAMRWAVMAVRIQREVGGNLAETLHTTATTLKERDTLRRQVRALSAEGRLSGLILIGLPIFVFLYLLMTNYEYVSQLWSQPLGWAMLAGAVVMMTFGVLWMRSIVRIEV